MRSRTDLAPHSYGEAEVVSAIVKITCFLGLIFTSLVITLGGAPNHERIGFRYWNNPGPWTNYNGEQRWPLVWSRSVRS